MSRAELVEYLSGPYPNTRWAKYPKKVLLAIYYKTVRRLGGR